LFGRDEEYSELSRLTKSGLWVAIIGKRMTGKTSLIKHLPMKMAGST